MFSGYKERIYVKVECSILELGDLIFETLLLTPGINKINNDIVVFTLRSVCGCSVDKTHSPKIHDIL